MALELTLSCDSDKTESGPILIHSTGVEHYKIPPDVIRILQENLTNDLIADNEEGVLCQDRAQRILDILRQNGFNLQNQTNDDQKTVWTVVKNSGGGHGDTEQPDAPNPTSNDDNEADAEGEDQGGDEGENKEEEEE